LTYFSLSIIFTSNKWINTRDSGSFGHFTPDGNRSFIPLIKKSATTTPYKGMILINPEGQEIPVYASSCKHLNWIFCLQVTTSSLGILGEFGLSLPSENCAETQTTKRINRRSGDKLYGPRVLEADILGLYNYSKEIGQACQAQIVGPDDIGRYMSTAYEVRDMISILDVYTITEDGRKCDNPSLLNYWGFSYGPFLGETFASMCPERVGHVVLDGDLLVSYEHFALCRGRNSLRICGIYVGRIERRYLGPTAHSVDMRVWEGSQVRVWSRLFASRKRDDEFTTHNIFT
jgi:hypothetical protein